MSLRTILVPLTSGFDLDLPLDAALAVTRRVGAHIEALFVRPDALSTIGLLGEPAVGADAIVAAFERQAREAADAARRGFEDWRGAKGCQAGSSSIGWTACSPRGSRRRATSSKS